MNYKIIMLLFVACALCVVGCKKANDIKCGDKMKDVPFATKDIGSSFQVTCPAGCTEGSVWGSGTYTTDSSICLSAVHAGVIEAAKGGVVKVTLVKSLPSYTGSEANGVKTSDWSSSWGDTAFQVSK